MSGLYSTSHRTNLDEGLQRLFMRLFVTGLSALAVIEPMFAATSETFNPVRQAVVLMLLIIMALAARPWLFVTRELTLYTIFTVYMCITLIWAPSLTIAVNTLVPALDYILLSLLFGSLVAYHNLSAVTEGALGGFLFGALVYTRSSGFPFVYPPEFSYNAIAGMYLGGLYITLIFAWHSRLRSVPLLIGLVILVLIAATTSIKTNLGIALGVAAAALMYFRTFLHMFLRNIIVLSLLGAVLVYAILSNEGVLARVQGGFDRVSQGVGVLQRREDVAGTTSFGDRTDWKNEGIKGWKRSPLFGNGVEAFRADVGITSHSTPIDLLYNTGLIGIIFFYGLFVSLGVRLLQIRDSSLGSLPALIFGGLVCYSFITLSSTMHYNSFMAIFFAVSIGLLLRPTQRGQGVPIGGDRPP
jgi:hypothetical protein